MFTSRDPGIIQLTDISGEETEERPGVGSHAIADKAEQANTEASTPTVSQFIILFLWVESLSFDNPEVSISLDLGIIGNYFIMRHIVLFVLVFHFLVKWTHQC